MSSNVNDDFLKEAVSEYCEEKLYAKDKMDDFVASDEFRTNMDRLIRTVDKRTHKTKGIFRLKWVACVASVLIVISVIIGLNTDARAGCLDFIKALFSGSFDSYKTVENDDNVEDIVGFNMNYIPEGYELEKEECTSVYKAYIYSKDRCRLSFYYSSDDSRLYTLVDNEYMKHDIVVLDDGTKCDYYFEKKYNSESGLIWKMGKYVCYLSKNYDEDCNLVKIANSITPIYE